MSPKTCSAIKKHWNNKFYNMVAFCWFFLWDLYYNARIHERQVYVCTFIFCLVLSKPGGTKQNLITFMNHKSVFMMQLRELHQQCYNTYSEQSWTTGNTTFKRTATIYILLKIQ
jgi:hypothetical protein